ncbi:MAG: hypothetical protein Q7J57_09280, partial [Gemmobacter sp.]|nr:hypothetical protein [Gemmobacter sp.]
MPRLLSAVVWAFVAVLASISMIKADEMSLYDLRSAEFKLPADWKVTYSRRDQQYDFISPDGRFELWARWWFPDEPLLGYSDIVHHETRQLAGQDALFRHIEAGGTRSLEVAFLKKDAEGEMFLWQLHSGNTSLAEHQAMFDRLLADLAIDGLPALAAAAPVVTPSTLGGAGGEMYLDPDGVFGLPLPPGWTVQSTASSGVRQAVLVNPTRDALLLVATATPDRGMTAAQILDEYLGVLYRDSLIVKSIEDERYPTIAGNTVHGIETISKVYAINGIAMPYARGRVWVYQTGDESEGRPPFLIVSIRPEAAPQAITDTLERMVAGFTLDPKSVPAHATGDTPLGVAQVDTPQGQAEAVAGALPEPTQGSFDKGLLFDGKSIAGLLPFSFNDVTFEKNARLTGNEITFDFPDDRGWAKLGLATPNAVVAMPARDSATTQRITAIMDADKSTGISFALSAPPDAEKDPDTVHDVKLQFSAAGDGIGKLEVTTREPRQSVKATFAWPKGETVLNVLLRPDQVIDVRDGSGTQLAQAAMNADFAGRQWALQTFVQVPQKNRAASLVLKRLSFDTIPFEPGPKVDAIAGDARSVVVFDGTAFDPVWKLVSRREAEIAGFARLADGALR